MNYYSFLTETLEMRITKPFSNFHKYITLYHAFPKKLKNDIVDPAYGMVNIGTKLSKPRYSTWWMKEPFNSFTYDIYFWIDYNKLIDKDIYKKLIKQRKIEEINFLYAKILIKDIKNKVIYINKKYKKIFISYYNNQPFYVYQVTVPTKIVGRGHNVELEEFTLDRPIKADKVYKVNYNTLNKHIKIEYCNEDEMINKYRYLDDYSKKSIYKSNILEKMIYYKNKDMRAKRKEFRKISRKYLEKIKK